jgi:hypothetical protein
MSAATQGTLTFTPTLAAATIISISGTNSAESFTGASLTLTSTCLISNPVWVNTGTLTFSISAPLSPPSSTNSGFTVTDSLQNYTVTGYTSGSDSGTITIAGTNNVNWGPDAIWTMGLNHDSEPTNVAAFSGLSVTVNLARLTITSFTVTLSGANVVGTWPTNQATASNFLFDQFVIGNGTANKGVNFTLGTMTILNVGSSRWFGYIQDINSIDESSWTKAAIGNAERKLGSVSPSVYSYLIDDLLP